MSSHQFSCPLKRIHRGYTIASEIVETLCSHSYASHFSRMLKKTSKFSAYDLGSKSIAAPAPSLRASGQVTTLDYGFADFEKNGSGTVTLSKGKRISLDDVVNVAVNFYQIVYEAPADAAASLNVPLKAVPVSNSSSNGEFYSLTVSRAAIFVRVVALLNGPLAWRNDVIEAIVQLLNDNTIPRLSNVRTAGEELVAAITGSYDASFYFDGAVVGAEQLIEDDALNAIGLTVAEATCLSLSPFLATGIAALTASGACRLASMIDGVAAFSCEAFGASVEPFDATLFETYRQHRGQLTSASNLRALLEGSMRINNPISKDASVKRVFASLPLVTGPSVDSIISAAKYVISAFVTSLFIYT